MKTKKIGLGFLSIVMLSSLVLNSENTQVDSLAMPLTQEGGTARAMSMGSAATGVPQGPASLFWNPAGLGSLGDCLELGLHHNSGLGDSIHETAVIGRRIGFLGGFAASLNYVNNGIFEGRDSAGNLTGNYTAGNLGLGLGWGKEFFTGISAGIAVKFNQQTLAGRSYSAYAADAGILWNPLSRLNLGLAYSNLGTEVAGKILDSGLRLGASYGVTGNILLALSSELKPDGLDGLQAGIEGFLHPRVALRAGYVYNFKDSKLDGLTGLTGGLGIKIVKNIILDYAYLPFGELGVSHRISLNYKFICPEKIIYVQPKPVITGINPISGPSTGGTLVVITGSGFAGTTGSAGLEFGTMNAEVYTVDSDKQITAIAPEHAAGAVDIVATNSAGTSPLIADKFTYFILPAITGINPTFGPSAGGTAVVITGSGFTGITGPDGVKFGAQNAALYTVDSDKQITATSPGQAAGIVDIVATGPSGVSLIVPTGGFTYIEPVPAVEPIVVVLEKLIVLEDAHFEFDEKTQFEFDSVFLTEEGAKVVTENTQILRENPEAKIRIAGYASASGSEEYNQKLSERRAKAIEKILLREGGISPERITTIGYGEMRPSMFEPLPGNIDSIEARANMRVLFEIIVK